MHLSDIKQLVSNLQSPITYVTYLIKSHLWCIEQEYNKGRTWSLEDRD